MNISVNLTSSTAEASASASQTVDTVGAILSRNSLAQGGFGGFDTLHFSLNVSHPLAGYGGRRGSGSYHAASRTFYATTSMNYMAWIGANWVSRVEAVADALRLATAAIHKTRITEAERSTILELISASVAEANSAGPPILAELRPVHLTYYAGHAKPAVSFVPEDCDIPDVERVVELRPEEISNFLERHPTEPPERRLELFKRYRRGGAGLAYFEAWPTEKGVTEHQGFCGDRGQTSDHPASAAVEKAHILKRLKAKATGLGFKTVPLSRHVHLVVERSIDGAGTADDLDERHALENFLNEAMGWLGLGHCDGGSTGSGSTEAFCFAVDPSVAIAVLERELASSRFKSFSVRKSR